MKNIFVLGSLNMDLSVKSDEMPDLGETICGSEFKTCPGGKGLNQAVAASKLNGNVSFLGSIGDDQFGKEMVESLSKWHVNTENIHIRKDVSSGVAVIIVEKGNNRIILDLGANLIISKRDVDTFLEKANKGDIFLCQLENDIDIVGYALKEAKGKQMITIVNPAPVDEDILLYKQYIDILTPNEIEIDMLAHTGEDYKKAYKKLDIPTVIVTLGEDGCTMMQKHVYKHFNCIHVHAVDSTGAGDTFNGGLAAFMSQECDFDDAISSALLAASISVTRRGSSVSSPTLDELNMFCEYKD